MNRTTRLAMVVGLLAVGLSMLPVLGLPYGRLDWTVFSQGYEEQPPNLAFNQPAFASTYLVNYPPSLAVDGDPLTTWQSYYTSYQWLYVTLEHPQWINQVVVQWGDFYALSYRISIRIPGGYWIPVFETHSGTGGIEFVDFTRIYGDTVLIELFYPQHGLTRYSIAEFQVFYLGTNMQDRPNLAAGKSAVASSWQPDHEPSLAIDGDLATAWWSDPAVDSYGTTIFVDLGNTYPVQEVTLYWGDNYAASYTLYAWVFVWSGWYGFWAWWPLYDGVGSADQDLAVFRLPVDTRYVRLVAWRRAHQEQGLQVAEFEVYGTAQPSSSESFHYLSPGEVTQESLQRILTDVVPPGWEKSPVWHLTPSPDRIVPPEALPAGSLPPAIRPPAK